jgi:tRNA-uridine 2-sulfurtransferase
MAKQRVVVGLSGGVDSAVTAYLLKQQGYEVIGIFMKNWEDDDRPAGSREDLSAAVGEADDAYCTSNIDFVDAAAVADVLGIEIEHVNFAAEYKDRVFAEFLREYKAGRTPNPDILCNAEIKFKSFLDHAMRLGAEKIATGHYARVRLNEGTGKHELLKGLDPSKDQSYFLHRLSQAQLSKTLFPVGELLKTEVRRIATEIGLPNAKKKDSTGICFIGERPFRDFLNRYIAKAPGPIKSDHGRVLGEHVGLSFYTLGQRQGIGIGGVKAKGADLKAAQARGQRGVGEHQPWFVARKDIEANTLWVVQGHDHPWLQSFALHAQDASWVAGHAPVPGRYAAKSRYRQVDSTCTLNAVSGVSGVSGESGDAFSLDFPEPQWAVTPGQSAVLYDGEVCLGGGVIDANASVGAGAGAGAGAKAGGVARAAG